MAVPKDNRPSGCGTTPFFLEAFRNHGEPDERERAWHSAMAHAGEGSPPLRFPAYEALYLINVYAQKLIDLLDVVGNRLGIGHESREYHQSLIQLVRAYASQDIAEYMGGVELTEEWLFERLRIKEEKTLLDPEDVYISVRRREAERASQGLPPRIQFLEEMRGDESAGDK